MRGNSKVEKDRREWFMDNCYPDYIMEERYAPDFTEFVSSTGGDVTRTRVYGDSPENFKCYEK